MTQTMTRKHDKAHDAATGEARYLLDRWEFSVSSTGLLWIQPTRSSLTPEELAGMFSLLAEDCQNDMPKMIKLDLSGVRIVGEQWTTIEAMIIDFAHQIRAEIRLARSTRGPASSVIFSRPVATGNEPGPLPPAA